MRALAESGLHSRRQRDGVLAVLFAQPVGGRQCLVPLLVRALAVEADLLALFLPMRSMHAQQADSPSLPVCAEELAYGSEYLGVNRRWPVQGMRARNGVKVRVA